MYVVGSLGHSNQTIRRTSRRNNESVQTRTDDSRHFLTFVTVSPVPLKFYASGLDNLQLSKYLICDSSCIPYRQDMFMVLYGRGTEEMEVWFGTNIFMKESRKYFSVLVNQNVQLDLSEQGPVEA